MDKQGELFPNGSKGKLRLKQRTIGFENQFTYEVLEGNTLTFGFQYEWIHQHDISSAEFTFDPSDNFSPVSPPRDFSSDFPFTRRVTRQIWALYLQDEWDITKDIDLTVGVRYDYFTRFGGTANPRIGLEWRFLENAHLKLLFATAFRAPNFFELFTTNNPVLRGDPNLDPEKINTYEVGLYYDFTPQIKGGVNYYFNRIRDRIVRVPTGGNGLQTLNLGGARIMGVEAEIKAFFGQENYLYANYTFQNGTDIRLKNRLPDVPIHKANFGLNLGMGKYVNANLHAFVSGPRPREGEKEGIGDSRRDLPSHTLVDLTIIGKNFMDNFEVRGSVFNLFDKGYDDPAPKGTVTSDYPQPKRSFVIEMRYEF